MSVTVRVVSSEISRRKFVEIFYFTLSRNLLKNFFTLYVLIMHYVQHGSKEYRRIQIKIID